MSEIKCLNCGSELIWQSDFDFEDYGMDGEGIVSVWECPSCGSTNICEIPCGEQKEN